MDYFNPFTNITPPMPPMIKQIMSGQGQQRAPIDQQQFRQYAITLNDNTLNAFAQKARAQGISEEDIQAGI